MLSPNSRLAIYDHACTISQIFLFKSMFCLRLNSFIHEVYIDAADTGPDARKSLGGRTHEVSTKRLPAVVSPIY